MILTFARLQRLSDLERKGPIKRWLQKRGIAYSTDSKGRPFTTLDALNTRLHHGRTNNQLTTGPDYGAFRARYQRTAT